jgi:pimeloyl-ACP methyl ester carboxylesterase
MHKVIVDGSGIEYLRIPASSPDRPALLLLHEGLGCAARWKEFPELLAAATRCEVVAYSRRGYGGSEARPLPWPLTYMHEEAAALQSVLTALGLERVIAIGHSDGASIAIIAAGSGHIRGLEGMVLESPHVFTEEHGLEAIRETRVAYRETDLRERMARYHENVDVAFYGWYDAWTHPDFRNWNLERYLPAIDVPVLLIQEEDDPYGTITQLDAIEAGVPGPVERLVLDGTGHSPHHAHPEAVAAAIGRFVESCR